MGITLLSPFTMFAAKATGEQRIPFEVNVDPFFSKANIQRLEKADANAGINMTEHKLIGTEE